MIVLHLFNTGPFDVDTIVYVNFSMKLRRNPFVFLKRKLFDPVHGILFSYWNYFEIKRILLDLAYFKLKTSRATLTIGPHYQKPQTFAEIETVIGFAVIAVVAI